MKVRVADDEPFSQRLVQAAGALRGEAPPVPPHPRRADLIASGDELLLDALGDAEPVRDLTLTGFFQPVATCNALGLKEGGA